MVAKLYMSAAQFIGMGPGKLGDALWYSVQSGKDVRIKFYIVTPDATGRPVPKELAFFETDWKLTDYMRSEEAAKKPLRFPGDGYSCRFAFGEMTMAPLPPCLEAPPGAPPGTYNLAVTPADKIAATLLTCYQYLFMAVAHDGMSFVGHIPPTAKFFEGTSYAFEVPKMAECPSARQINSSKNMPLFAAFFPKMQVAARPIKVAELAEAANKMFLKFVPENIVSKYKGPPAAAGTTKVPRFVLYLPGVDYRTATTPSADSAFAMVKTSDYDVAMAGSLSPYKPQVQPKPIVQGNGQSVVHMRAFELYGSDPTATESRWAKVNVIFLPEFYIGQQKAARMVVETIQFTQWLELAKAELPEFPPELPMMPGTATTVDGQPL